MTAPESYSLECKICGSEIFVRDEPWWTEDEEETCAECGTMYTISVDYEQAHASTNEYVEDVGQPRCDNSCGLVYMQSPALVAEFLGSPCLWNCERAKAHFRALESAIATELGGAP